MKQDGLLQIPILPGMREDIDKRAGATPGTIAYAQNLRFRQVGKAQRRNGTTALVTTAEPTSVDMDALGYAPDFITGHAGSAVVGVDGYAWRYDTQESVWRLAGFPSSSMPVGNACTLYAHPGASAHQAIHGAATVAIDSAGYMVAAYCINETGVGFGHICIALYFDPGGRLIDRTQYSSSIRCRAVAVGATIYLCLQDSAATNAVVEAWTYSAGNINGGATTLVTLDAQADSWDVSPWPGASAANRWLIVWYDSSSTTVTVRRLNALATENSTTFTPAGAPRIACYANTNHAWIGTVDDTSEDAIMQAYQWTGAAFGAVIGPTIAWSFTAATQDSSPPIPGPSDSATRSNYTGWILTTTAGLSTTGVYELKSGDYTTAAAVQTTTQYGAYPISYPFGAKGEYTFVDVLTNADTANGGANGKRRSAVLKRWRFPSAASDARGFLELTTKRNAQWINDVARVDRWTRAAQRPNGNWVMPVAVWIPDDSTGAIYYEFLEFEAPCLTTRTYDFAANALTLPGQPVDLLAGGNFLGNTEVGVVHPPVIIASTPQGGAGSMIAGEYKLCACYRWIDSSGRVRRSAPSEIVTVTLALNDAITLTVSCISLFRADLTNGDLGQIELYGTPADESVFYLVDDSKLASGGASQTYTALNYLAADITDNIELYTDGGVQQNDMAPACRAVVATEESLVCGPMWQNPTLWQESKPAFPEEQMTFSDFDGYKIQFPEPTVTGAYMDGTLIVWAERAIYAAYGRGPDDRGANGSRTIRCVAPNIGCANERSVLVTPIGCFFESHRGIELLPRGLGAPDFENYGAKVQDQLALRPVILDAALHYGKVATTAQFLIKGEPHTPVFDASSVGGVFPGSSFSFSHQLGSGSNRRVFVGVHFDTSGSAPVTGAAVTFNGVAMSLIATSITSTDEGLFVFEILEASLPGAGLYTVAVSYTGGGTSAFSQATAECVSFKDCGQGAITPTSASGASTTPSRSITTTGTLSLIVDLGATIDTGNLTVNAGQTELIDSAAGTGSKVFSSIRDAAAAGSYTMGWTKSGSGAWRLVALELVAVDPGSRILSYDLDAKAWSLDDYPIDGSAIGDTPLGLLLASDDLSTEPAFLLEDTSQTATDDNVFFEGRLRLHHFYPAGLIGVTHAHELIARVTLDANPSTVTLSLGLDDLSPRVNAFTPGTDTSALLYYGLEPANASCATSSVQVEAYDATAGGVTWCGFVLRHTPEPENTRAIPPANRA